MGKRVVGRRGFLGGMAALVGLALTGHLTQPSALAPEADPQVLSQDAPSAPTVVDVVSTIVPTIVPVETATPVPTRVVPLVQPPKLVPRDVWGARKASGAYRAHEPSRITVHHTAVVWKGGDAARHLRGIQDFHMGPERGWVDIACHYLIDRDGLAYVGRPETAMPDTATAGYNTRGHLAVCVLGDFDTQQPSEQQMAALEQVVAWWMQRYSIPSSLIAGHRDFAATSCPGKNLYASLKDGSIQAGATRLLAV